MEIESGKLRIPRRRNFTFEGLFTHNKRKASKSRLLHEGEANKEK